jgi:prepilin-type N-terminal cleavage/methylation domain-containing protein
MRPMRQRPQGGFTLVELMITVFILSLLSSVAIVSFTRYLRRAKSAEAPISLSAIARSAKVYWMVDHAAANGTVMARQFPATTMHPGFCCDFNGGRCPGARNATETFSANNTWRDLAFGIDDPHVFTYNFTTTGGRARASAEAYLGACFTTASYKSFAVVLDGDASAVAASPIIEDYSGG